MVSIQADEGRCLWQGSAQPLGSCCHPVQLVLAPSLASAVSVTKCRSDRLELPLQLKGSLLSVILLSLGGFPSQSP